MSQRTFYLGFILSVLFVANVYPDEQKILLQNTLIASYPGYFFPDDYFFIIGDILSKENHYTIIYNQHFWGNGRMTGRMVLFNGHKIIGNYGVINEFPEIVNNGIVFKGIENDHIDFSEGIPTKILIDGQIYTFEYFNGN